MLLWDPEKCIKCGLCVGVCPVNALTLSEKGLNISEKCIECGNCVRACPVGALRLEGGKNGKV